MSSDRTVSAAYAVPMLSTMDSARNEQMLAKVALLRMEASMRSPWQVPDAKCPAWLIFSSSRARRPQNPDLDGRSAAFVAAAPQTGWGPTERAGVGSAVP